MTTPTSPQVSPLAAAAAALRLHRHPALRLSGLLCALCGWLVATGAASLWLLHNVYQAWDLPMAERLTIYLPAESDPTLAPQLAATLPTLSGVRGVAIVSPSVVAEWVQTWLPATPGAPAPSAHNLPLPIVLQVNIAPDAPRAPLLASLHSAAPMAEIADHQPIRAQVAGAVHLLQTALAILVGSLALLMAGLMALAVHAALQAHLGTLKLLLLLGSPDALLQAAVRRVVLRRTLAGWALAAGCALAMLGAGAWAYPPLATLVTPAVIATTLAAPLLLPLLAVLVAHLTVRRTLHQLIP